MKRRVAIVSAYAGFTLRKFYLFFPFNESVTSIRWPLGLGDVDDKAYVEFDCRRDFQCDRYPRGC